MEVDDLSQAIEAYKKGRSTLDQFADWFRGVSRQKFAESVQVQQAILEIDSLFSRLDFEGLPEASFRGHARLPHEPPTGPSRISGHRGDSCDQCLQSDLSAMLVRPS